MFNNRYLLFVVRAVPNYDSGLIDSNHLIKISDLKQ